MPSPQIIKRHPLYEPLALVVAGFNLRKGEKGKAITLILPQVWRGLTYYQNPLGSVNRLPPLSTIFPEGRFLPTYTALR